MVTKQVAAGAILSYLRHEISLTQFVGWAEDSLLEAQFSDEDMDVLTRVFGRLGLADVRTFGLSWEECEEMMHMLGYTLQVQMMEPV
jgi:hypothetical protein